MGGGHSRTETVTKVVVQQSPTLSPEQMVECEAAVKQAVDKELEEMREEVSRVEPMIKENVRTTVDTVEGCDIFEYEDLQNRGKIVEDLTKTFQGCKGSAVLIEMATGAIEAMKDRKELRKMTRWQQRKRIQVAPGRGGQKDQVVGIELHYKVAIADETISETIMKKFYKKMTASDYEHKKTTVLVAYKVLTHAMEHDPSEHLTKEQLDSIDF